MAEADARNDARAPQYDYWAREDETTIAARMMEKVNDYLHSIQRSGRLDLWRRSNQMYYGMDGGDGGVRADGLTFGGEQGEIVMTRENHFRFLVGKKHALVTGTRPSFKAKANNSDSESLEDANIAQGIFEYYLDNPGPADEGVESATKRVALYNLRFGEGYLVQTWNPSASAGMPPRGVELVTDENGEQVIDEDGKPLTRHVFAGDFETTAKMPLDVIRDPGHDMGAGRPAWYIVHDRVSRWDLMADFPDLVEEIANVASIPNVTVDIFTRDDFESDDYVSVYTLWHDRRPAIPEGRMVAIVGDHVLVEGPLPYERVPVLEMVSDPEDRSAHGYADAFDLMGPQEVVDACISTAITNNDAGGVLNFWTPTGSDLSVEDLRAGVSWWESAEKPEAIVMAPVADTTWKLRETMVETMNDIYGINEVARGKPDAGMSGAAMALVHSISVESAADEQHAYGRLLERTANHMWDIIKRHMDHERIISIAGFKARQYNLSKETLPASVRRFSVELGSAMQRNMSGRYELAKIFFEMQAVTDPEQFMQVVATGRFEPILEGPSALYRGLQQENEALVRGAPFQATMFDHHMKHIQAHEALMRDPAMRGPENQDLQQRVLDHIREHVELWKDASADQQEGWPMLLATGQQPLPGYGEAPPGEEQPAAGGGGGGNPGGEMPQGGPGAVAPMETAASGVQNMISGPTMPENPATGREYSPDQAAGPR